MPRRVPRAVTSLALGLIALSAGCGGGVRSGAPTPEVASPVAASAMVPVEYPAAGLRLRVPADWQRRRGRAPLVATLDGGQAVIALWRYSRAERLPTGHASLEAAKRALVAQIARRDPAFHVRRARLLHVGTERGVQVLGTSVSAGRRQVVRSTHIYTGRSEYVVDAAAPPTLFPRVDHLVFAPLLESLTISTPAG